MKANPMLQQNGEITAAGIKILGKGKYQLPASGLVVNRRVALFNARAAIAKTKGA